tara:strand:- start:1549 stop:2577 length:1029 start_codon:yes stop_codon:yes gene_type:complete
MAYTTINKSTSYFNTKLYTGNGGYSNAQTGVGFEPSFTWIKVRNYTSSHALFDAVRTGTKRLYSNTTDAQVTYSGGIQSFDTDGFTVGNGGAVNDNGYNFVSWNWKANGAGSTNNDGNITSTVSADTTAGFSIVKWTGTGSAQTVGHGLGAAPNMIILKEMTSTSQWQVSNDALGWTKRLNLDDTSVVDTTSAIWNDTAPTSTVFSIGNSGAVSENGQTYIAYCFSEKVGYSKFGSYLGNGSADGAFVYTGFKPAFILGKNSNTTNGWFVFDNKRDTYNVVNTYLAPQNETAEASYTAMDFFSNGFKVRSTAGDWNGDGEKIIYMCFGQSLVGSNNVPNTAR